MSRDTSVEDGSRRRARVVGRFLTLVSSLELSWRAPYRNFTGHDKTGTCQWQNPLANASEPAPRSLAQEHMPESRTCGEASQGAQP